MRFTEALLPARLLRRYKRFLADVVLDSGEELTVHCPNSGAMTGCVGERWPVLISDSRNPLRKLRYTLEMVHNGVCWIGVNTHRANRIVEEGITGGTVSELGAYDLVRREVAYGQNSRIDLLLEGRSGSCHVEVKSVTMLDREGRYAFPDAVTERGRKHLVELRKVVGAGGRAVLFFLIQRSDGSSCTVAADVDPSYAAEMARALATGVEVLAYRANVQPASIELAEAVPFALP